MSQIISVHSFRGGTGKSNTTANIAALLALEGRRVGVIDTDIQSPGIHILFGLDEAEMRYALNAICVARAVSRRRRTTSPHGWATPVLAWCF